ncbi:MAG: HEAT repeat domain-containing protein [Prevotellaceae bacterium]|jgi:hypothetical protein|nr:HEAT repeat domain-containing protein [Prevotellaceae bacterium]
MKLLPLYDLLHEISRLFIAGSKFAKNDPRLLKQVAVFNRLGEKSAIFKKIAEDIEALAGADPADSSAKLLDISTLLYSMLYTQSDTADAEQQETKPAPVMALNDVRTDKSYLELKPLIEALVMQKGGRLGRVKSAFENGLCDDFRIYRLLDAALADRYTEFADYLENTVIPSIGKPIIPFIVNGFSYDGKMENIRRFRLLYRLGYSGISGMVDEILTGNSVAMQVEAVKTLGNDPKNEELLIKLSSDRQKSIRLAAYRAMADLNTETVQSVLVELFVSGRKKQDVSELGEILKIKLSDKFIPVLLEKAKASCDKCMALDKSTDSKAVIDAFEALRIDMSPLINNTGSDVLTFYREMFTDKRYASLSKIAESKACRIPGLIADAVAKSLGNTKEERECLKFLSNKSCRDEFRVK